MVFDESYLGPDLPSVRALLHPVSVELHDSCDSLYDSLVTAYLHEAEEVDQQATHHRLLLPQ